MGGSLSNKRMVREDFQQYINRLMPMLKTAIGDVEFAMVPYYEMKKDFGDVDFVVREHAEAILRRVNDTFNPDNLVVNDGIISFTFEDFQVDLICTKANYDTAIAYFAYNDLGNLLGRLYHKMGLKFGHEGLLYPLRDDRGSIREEIVVSKDMKMMLEFIGCDYEKWRAGFKTLEDVFNYVASSQYFDRGAYEGELSAINRKRDLKRKTFGFFMTWLEIAQPKSNYSFVSRGDRDSYIPAIDAFFGVSIAYQKLELAKKLERESRFKEKFSGDLLMLLTPLTGQELGRFLGQYKRHLLGLPAGAEISKDDNFAFEEAILGMDQESINRSISQFYVQ